MKIKVVFDLNIETGEYNITFSHADEKNQGKKIDQQKVANMLRKVVDQWNNKFKN